MSLAPIVLFVYNRPDHTKETIEALKKNELASESELFIYSDEAKNSEAKQGVDEVRRYLDSLVGFRKITLIKREENWGLANSIIDGVGSVITEYGKVIVLEDDLVTSPYFLKFMNDALEFYKDEQHIWHISGWNYPIATENSEDLFLWRVMNCWGWATWKDRWSHYDKNIDKVMDEFSQKDIKRFNLDGVENFWGQIVLNKEKKINTWAIFWYATIFKNNGLCLNPVQTFVDNIGHDGSGVHCTNVKNYEDKLQQSYSVTFNKMENESVFYMGKIKEYLHTPILEKIKRVIRWK